MTKRILIKGNWYGIAGIKFVYHGDYADPSVIYDGKEINVHSVEDMMFDEYNKAYPPPKDYHSSEYERWYDEFAEYMFENQDSIKERITECEECYTEVNV